MSIICPIILYPEFYNDIIKKEYGCLHMIDYPTLHLDRNQYRNIAFIVYIVNEGRHMIIVNNHKINIKMTLSILLKLYSYVCFQKVMQLSFPAMNM
jgi:hypothetical protein